MTFMPCLKKAFTAFYGNISFHFSIKIYLWLYKKLPALQRLNMLDYRYLQRGQGF
jgi:hypothetical protein